MSRQGCLGALSIGAIWARGKMARLMYEAKWMRIEALISAADAAGYAMVSEESSGDFGADEIVSLKSETSQSAALAVWHPVVAAGSKSVGSQFANAWSWVAGRFITSAPA